MRLSNSILYAAERGVEGPLRRLVRDAAAWAEGGHGRNSGELRWATQPYAAAPGPGGDRAEARAAGDGSVLLFPGQGALRPGAGLRLAAVPPARDLYSRASDVLGWDVWRLCTEGPSEELVRHEQVCTVVTALAALEAARDQRPAALQAARAAAGFSLGEFAALVAAGALSLEATLRVLTARQAAVAAAHAARPGAMVTVWLQPAAGADLRAALAAACDAARSPALPEPVCSVAADLFPGCKVVAGDEAAAAALLAGGAVHGVRRAARVPAAAAFHCVLLSDVRAAVEAALAREEVRTPRLRVVACAEARPYGDAGHVRRGLARLAERPVRWEQTLQALYSRPRAHAQPLTLALGPSGGLRASLKMVNARAWDASLQIEV